MINIIMAVEKNSFMSTIKSTDESLDALDRKTLEDFEKMLRRKKILSLYTIKQFQSGEYAGIWYTKIENKKYQRKSKEELENFIIEYHREKEKKDVICLERFAEDYLKSRKNTVALSTWKKDCDRYEMYISTSDLAKKDIAEITIKDANVFWEHCKKLYPKMKKKYWNGIITTVNGLMRYVMLAGYRFDNPFDIFKPHKDLFDQSPPKNEADVFSRAEEAAVCQIAMKDAEEKGCLEPLGIIILFKTGLRVGEICALKWKDIEICDDGKYLHVQREMAEHIDVNTRKMTGYELLNHCKSNAGNRLIPMTAELTVLFKEVKKLALQNNFPIGLDDFIFHRKKGKTVDVSNRSGFNARIRKYCNKSGMEVIKSLHDIRRTFITNLYNSGCPLKTVQEIAGHSSEEMTLKYLRRKADDNALEYMERLSA